MEATQTEYVIYEQEKSTILRIFDRGGHYGDPFALSLYCSYYGKWNDTVLLEGLDKRITGSQRKALMDYFAEKGVRFVKWDHHDKQMCFSTVEQKLRIE